jgi:PKD repeat protein
MEETPQPLDGLSAPKPDLPEEPRRKSAAPDAPQDPKTKAVIRRWKTILLGGGALFYGLYAMWGLLLLTILPSADPQMKALVPVGVGSAVLGALVFLAVGAVGFSRIGKSKLSPRVRQRSLIKLIVAVVPGLLLSAAVPFLIMREPALTLRIISPTNAADLVAPLSMTFSAEQAVTTLAGRGVRVTSYKWDLNGDGKTDQETLEPRLIVNFEREGIYLITANLATSDGKPRPVSLRFTIRQAVFAIMPNPPVVKKPLVLSVANLVKDKTLLKEVRWDFNEDGTADETTKDSQVTYTFYKTGEAKVTAIVVLNNNTQASYSRTITIEEPRPLPFEIAIVTEPKNLIGPPPFPVLFRVDTKVPLSEVEWSFGDNTKETGERVLHEYTSQGNYVVSARVRAESGTSAILDSLVRVVEELPLPDLQLDSEINIAGSRIEGTVPLRLDITPRTSVQFVQFSWEAPDASEVGSLQDKLQAIYRKEGTYKLVLLAQDVVNRATRREFTVVVKPQQAVVDFKVIPDTGVAPLKVQLDSSDTSLPPEETPTGYLWRCDAQAPAVARGGISTCNYDREGTYQITLTVRTQSGKEYSKTKTIVVRPPVVSACFLPTRSRAKVGQLIGFPLECSSGGWQTMNVLWDFGDRTQREWTYGDEDMVHSYTSPGIYIVTLTFTDPNDPLRQFNTTRNVTIEP